MNSLSCIARVKRTTDNDFNRPPDFPQYVFASFTGDRSGSMSSMININNHVPAKGLYDFIKSQCNNALLNNQTAYISVTTFDNEDETFINNEKSTTISVGMNDCINWMDPRGSTKLYDTAIKCLNKLENNAQNLLESLPKNIKKLNPKITKIWSLLTDGFDNASFSTAEDLRRTVLKARGDGTICYFLAANMDAEEVGESFGFSAQNAMTFDADADHAEVGMRSVTANMIRSASNGVSAPFTQMQRQSSQNTNMRHSSAPTSSFMNAINTPLSPLTFVTPPPLRRSRNQPPRMSRLVRS